MDDAERAFRDALHRVDSVKIPVPSLEPAEVRRTSGLGLVMSRWLAAAAVLAVVAGLGIWTLSGRSGPMAAVPAAPPSSAAAAKLTGTTWVAVQLYGQPTEAAPQELPFLVFSDDSTFSGGDPCNGLGGTYRQIGEELRLAPGAKTEIGCNSNQQTLFLKALDNTRRAIVDDEGYLELYDLPGTVLAIFQSTKGVPYPEPDEPTPSIVPTPTVDPNTPTGSLPTPVGSNSVDAVQIRIRNASAMDFTDVYAVFPSGEKVHYGPVPAGSVSLYEPVEQAYSYTYLKVTAAGKAYVLQPIDYVGESPLVSGRHYSYALDLVGSQVELKLEFDESTPTPR